MLRKLLLALVSVWGATTALAQVPRAIGVDKHGAAAISVNTPENCALQNAGSSTRTLGVGAKTNSKYFLCLGDSLLVRHNRDANLSNDPNPITLPGIGYAFYDCPPIVNGPASWAIIKTDPCLNHSPFVSNGTTINQTDSMWVTGSSREGDDNFVNDGVLQRGFNNGRPIKFYFAPITLDNFANLLQESTTSCVHVNTRDGMPTDTFSIVFLNAVNATELTYSSASSGSFRVLGGLPEYDGSAYTIRIEKVGFTGINGTITNGATPSHNATVLFTVPEAGSYRITITDGKSCDKVFVMHFPFISLTASHERAANTGDQACVVFTARDFNNISSLQGNILFNPSVVTYAGPRNFNLPELTAASFNLVQPGVIAFAWNRSNLANGVTRANDAPLFEICFNAIGAAGTGTAVRFSDTLNPLEASNSSLQLLGVQPSNGSIIIGVTPLSIRTRGDSVTCRGNNDGILRISASAAATALPIIYRWTRTDTISPINTGAFARTTDSARFTGLRPGTYQVTVTSALGEIRVATVVIGEPNSVLELDRPRVVPPRCYGDPTGQVVIRGNTYRGGTAPYTFRWSNNFFTNSVRDSTVGIVQLDAGYYSVTMTDARGCRVVQDSNRVYIDSIKITRQSLVNPRCVTLNNGSIVINNISGGHTVGSVYGFSWSNGIRNNGPNSAISGLRAGRYTVTITDDSTCRRVDTFYLNYERELQMSYRVNDVRCKGDSSGFIDISMAARGTQALPYTFAWSTFAGTPTNTQTTSLVTRLLGGNYQVNVRDNDGCRFDTLFVVTEPDTIRLDTLNIRPESCLLRNDGSATIEVTGGRPYPGGIYRYAWSRGRATDSVPTLNDLVAGRYRVTVTDAVGCFDTISVNIRIPTPPIIDSIRPTLPSCHNSVDGALQIFAANGDAAISAYLWSNGINSPLNPDIASGWYRFTISDALGCQTRDSVFLDAPDTLRVDTIRTRLLNPRCPDDSTGRISISLIGGTSPYSFAWSGGATQNNGIFPDLRRGNYSFTITDTKGCGTNYQATLSDPPKINVQFFDIQPVSCYRLPCTQADGRATIIANGGTANNGAYFFTWQSGEIGNNNSNTGSAVRLCQGWQRITVADANCFQVDSVWIPAPDSFSFTTPRIILPTCSGRQDGSIDVNVSGGVRPYRYQWNTGTSETAYLPNIAAGSYQVTITDNNSCTFSMNLRVNQPDSLKIVVVDTSSNAVRCFGEDNGRLTLRRTGGNAGGVNYQWSPNVSTSDMGVRLRAGVYSVTATDEKGCRDSINYIISQPDPIYFQMPRPIPPRCNGTETDITIDTAFGSSFRYPFVFSVDNFPPLALRGRFPVYAGNHQVSIIETVTGCRLDTVIRIIEPPAIRIDFDSIPNNPGLTRLSVGLGDSIRLNPRVYNDDNTRVIIDSIAWTPNRYLSFDAVGGQLQPFAKPLDDITYTLRIFDINGCLSEEFVTIELDRNRKIFIPTIFTPNNDDKNDVFAINAGDGVTKVNYFRVFNRWGSLVFERQGILPTDDKVASGWDGTFNGTPLLPDVYVYVAEVVFEDGKVLLYRGDVTLIR